MPTPNGCEAYQVSDQMTCPTCGLLWDMNDPDPPECGNTVKREAKRAAEQAGYVVLPADRSTHMVLALGRYFAAKIRLPENSAGIEFVDADGHEVRRIMQAYSCDG